MKARALATADVSDAAAAEDDDEEEEKEEEDQANENDEELMSLLLEEEIEAELLPATSKANAKTKANALARSAPSSKPTAKEVQQAAQIKTQQATISQLEAQVMKAKEYKQLTKTKLKSAAEKLRTYRLQLEQMTAQMAQLQRNLADHSHQKEAKSPPPKSVRTMATQTMARASTRDQAIQTEPVQVRPRFVTRHALIQTEPMHKQMVHAHTQTTTFAKRNFRTASTQTMQKPVTQCQSAAVQTDAEMQLPLAPVSQENEAGALIQRPKPSIDSECKGDQPQSSISMDLERTYGVDDQLVDDVEMTESNGKSTLIKSFANCLSVREHANSSTGPTGSTDLETIATAPTVNGLQENQLKLSLDDAIAKAIDDELDTSSGSESDSDSDLDREELDDDWVHKASQSAVVSSTGTTASSGCWESGTTSRNSMLSVAVIHTGDGSLSIDTENRELMTTPTDTVQSKLSIDDEIAKAIDDELDTSSSSSDDSSSEDEDAEDNWTPAVDGIDGEGSKNMNTSSPRPLKSGDPELGATCDSSTMTYAIVKSPTSSRGSEAAATESVDNNTESVVTEEEQSAPLDDDIAAASDDEQEASGKSSTGPSKHVAVSDDSDHGITCDSTTMTDKKADLLNSSTDSKRLATELFGNNNGDTESAVAEAEKPASSDNDVEGAKAQLPTSSGDSKAITTVENNKEVAETVESATSTAIDDELETSSNSSLCESISEEKEEDSDGEQMPATGDNSESPVKRGAEQRDDISDQSTDSDEEDAAFLQDIEIEFGRNPGKRGEDVEEKVEAKRLTLQNTSAYDTPITSTETKAKASSFNQERVHSSKEKGDEGVHLTTKDKTSVAEVSTTELETPIPRVQTKSTASLVHNGKITHPDTDTRIQISSPSVLPELIGHERGDADIDDSPTPPIPKRPLEESKDEEQPVDTKRAKLADAPVAISAKDQARLARQLVNFQNSIRRQKKETSAKNERYVSRIFHMLMKQAISLENDLRKEYLPKFASRVLQVMHSESLCDVSTFLNASLSGLEHARKLLVDEQDRLVLTEVLMMVLEPLILEEPEGASVLAQWMDTLRQVLLSVKPQYGVMTFFGGPSAMSSATIAANEQKQLHLVQSVSIASTKVDKAYLAQVCAMYGRLCELIERMVGQGVSLGRVFLLDILFVVPNLTGLGLIEIVVSAFPQLLRQNQDSDTEDGSVLMATLKYALQVLAVQPCSKEDAHRVVTWMTSIGKCTMQPALVKTLQENSPVDHTTMIAHIWRIAKQLKEDPDDQELFEFTKSLELLGTLHEMETLMELVDLKSLTQWLKEASDSPNELSCCVHPRICVEMLHSALKGHLVFHPHKSTSLIKHQERRDFLARSLDLLLGVLARNPSFDVALASARAALEIGLEADPEDHSLREQVVQRIFDWVMHHDDEFLLNHCPNDFLARLRVEMQCG